MSRTEEDRVVPLPSLILLGCQPWPPAYPPNGRCPVCGGQITDGARSYCAWEDRSAPGVEARLRADRLGTKVRDRDQASRKWLETKTKVKGSQVDLTEAERRRLWNGYRGSILRSETEPTNRAAVGRAFLIAIGQEPDWSLTLDRRGRMVGRVEHGSPASPAAHA